MNRSARVHQSLVCRQGGPNIFQTNAWCMWSETTISFTVPTTVPNGEYLARFEHIALHGAHGGEYETYYACAQIRVEGSSASSIPGPVTKIPGVYSRNSPELNFSVWNAPTSYPFIPGVDVCPGGTIRGSADGSVGFQVRTVAGGSNSGGGGGGSNSGGGGGGGGGNCASMWGQCGGEGWAGPTCCSSGSCRAQNTWFVLPDTLPRFPLHFGYEGYSRQWPGVQFVLGKLLLTRWLSNRYSQCV